MIPSLSVKNGVDLRPLMPQALFAIAVAQLVYAKRGFPLCVTSVGDSQHMPNSLHYKGFAVDIRLPSHVGGNTSDDLMIRTELADALGANGVDRGQYDVLLEDNHIHCEFDPKPGGTHA